MTAAPIPDETLAALAEAAEVRTIVAIPAEVAAAIVTELQQARATLASVEALHRPVQDRWCANCCQVWPCDTSASLAARTEATS